jgi:hypothetical protein
MLSTRSLMARDCRARPLGLWIVIYLALTLNFVTPFFTYPKLQNKHIHKCTERTIINRNVHHDSRYCIPILEELYHSLSLDNFFNQ